MNNIKNLLLPLIREAGKIMTGAREIEGAVSKKGGDKVYFCTKKKDQEMMGEYYGKNI